MESSAAADPSAHLRESTEELATKGLSSEEAFLIASLPIWSTLSYAVPILLFAAFSIATCRWGSRNSSHEIVEKIGKYLVLFSLGILIFVLLLRVVSYCCTAFAAQSLPAESFGKIATHTTIAGIAIGTLSLIAVCVGLGTLAKSLGKAKTS